MSIVKQIIWLIIFLLNGIGLMAQQHTEKIVREFTFNRKSPENVLRIENIDGFVHVVTHNSNKVVLEVERVIKPINPNGLRKAQEELKLEFEVSGDSIISYLKAPFIHAKRNNPGKGRNLNIDREPDYRFTHNFTVKVPQNTNVSVETINNGDISIQNLNANSIVARIINGPITLENVSGDLDAKTINGKLTVTYQENPKWEANLETLNGDIELFYQKALSATINFSSFNGDLYTDLADLQKLSPKIEKTNSSDGAKTTFKVDKATSFRTGGGTAQLNLKTFNGKVIVKSGS
ncbi:DUF4097 family beta strand repeat-containing protein [Pontibacter sp. SGAir0037]|uniref:DUF4097 family beta strand repeat-containing protein n=1 Tax=Pontibacter sp. SGAir0037 TaxID=2571030 RepID=UPI0010CD6134|nr:DUF4097 family beta strand repeat-containing protein [Pontibacter sp. SGAir0037]QCR22583.1 hypothetical protein C1N53_09700 [Pontibacter sp. SGAir0037]